MRQSSFFRFNLFGRRHPTTFGRTWRILLVGAMLVWLFLADIRFTERQGDEGEIPTEELEAPGLFISHQPSGTGSIAEKGCPRYILEFHESILGLEFAGDMDPIADGGTWQPHHKQADPRFQRLQMDLEVNWTWARFAYDVSWAWAQYIVEASLLLIEILGQHMGLSLGLGYKGGGNEIQVMFSFLDMGSKFSTGFTILGPNFTMGFTLLGPEEETKVVQHKEVSFPAIKDPDHAESPNENGSAASA